MGGSRASIVRMVTIQEIEKLATLARIELSGEEKEKLRTDAESILKYVSQIQKISADGGDEKDSLSGVPVNVMREDANPHESGLFTETLLSAAPKREGQYIKVKKIL